MKKIFIKINLNAIVKMKLEVFLNIHLIINCHNLEVCALCTNHLR